MKYVDINRNISEVRKSSMARNDTKKANSHTFIVVLQLE